MPFLINVPYKTEKVYVYRAPEKLRVDNPHGNEPREEESPVSTILISLKSSNKSNSFVTLICTQENLISPSRSLNLWFKCVGNI